MSTLYSDATLRVPEVIDTCHREQLDSFARPGTWFDGAERRAIVAEARRARVHAGLQALQSAGAEAEGDLSEPVRRIARTVAVRTNDLDRSFVDEARSEGLTDEQYVETVGIVARCLSLDVFARGIRCRTRPVPAPASGEPTRVRPEAATGEGAWVPTVPGGKQGGEDAIVVYGSGHPAAAPFIFRGLSLVPPEAQGLIAMGAAQYVPIDDFMDFGYRYESGVHRSEVETVAARVSALNECFY